jgi:predicted transcriptional regulator
MPDVQLSDLQLALMRVVWDRGEATATDVHAAMSERLAPTTVATMLTRLERRGLLGHRLRGRAYVYYARVPEHEVRRSMLTRLTDWFFGGDPRELLSHLLGTGQVSPDELASIERLIAAHKRESNDDGEG